VPMVGMAMGAGLMTRARQQCCEGVTAQKIAKPL